MNSIFRYPGGKTRKSVRDKIFARFPKQYDEYREPFCGGSGIYFNVPIDKKRWINDINPDLMSVYFALRDNPNEFISKCREIIPESPNEPKTSSKNGKELYNARLKDVFDKRVEQRHDDPALSYYFINRTVWAGRVNYGRPSRLYYSNPSGWNIVKTNKLEQAAKLLANTEITVGDYKLSLEKDGKDVLIYCDPPYYVQTYTSGGSQLYEYCFTEQDHIDLYEAIKNCKHKVCVSYDNHDFIRDLYKDFNLFDETWTYCGTSNEKKQKGKELIITNY